MPSTGPSKSENSLGEIADICKVVVWQVSDKGLLAQIIGWEGINNEVDSADLIGRDISVVKND